LKTVANIKQLLFQMRPIAYLINFGRIKIVYN